MENNDSIALHIKNYIQTCGLHRMDDCYSAEITTQTAVINFAIKRYSYEAFIGFHNLQLALDYEQLLNRFHCLIEPDKWKIDDLVTVTKLEDDEGLFFLWTYKGDKTIKLDQEFQKVLASEKENEANQISLVYVK